MNTDRESSRHRPGRLAVGLVAAVVGGGLLIVTAAPASAHHGPPPPTIVGAFDQAQVPLGLNGGRSITLGVCRGTVAHGYRVRPLLGTWTSGRFAPASGCRNSAVQILFQPAGDVAHWSPEGTSERDVLAVSRVRGQHRLLRTVVTVTDVNGLQGRFFADAPPG